MDLPEKFIVRRQPTICVPYYYPIVAIYKKKSRNFETSMGTTITNPLCHFTPGKMRIVRYCSFAHWIFVSHIKLQKKPRCHWCQQFIFSARHSYNLNIL